MDVNGARTQRRCCAPSTPTVVGWSSGGIVALDLAAHHSDLVAGLVLLEFPLHAKKRPGVRHIAPSSRPVSCAGSRTSVRPPKPSCAGPSATDRRDMVRPAPGLHARGAARERGRGDVGARHRHGRAPERGADWRHQVPRRRPRRRAQRPDVRPSEQAHRQAAAARAHPACHGRGTRDPPSSARRSSCARSATPVSHTRVSVVPSTWKRSHTNGESGILGGRCRKEGTSSRTGMRPWPVGDLL